MTRRSHKNLGLTAEEKAAVLAALKRADGNRMLVARELGINRTTVTKLALAAGIISTATQQQTEAAGDGAADFVRDERDDQATIKVKSDKPVRTLADALRVAEVDTTVWRVRKWKAVSGEVGMKLRAFDSQGKTASEKPHTHPVWWLTVELERILPRSLSDALDGVFDRLRKHAPKYPKVRLPRASREPHLMVLDLVDVHFGKLAWRAETGQDYDLKLADRVYRHALRDLLDRAAGFRIEEFLIPLGSDFLHVDGLGNTTVNGTPQDVDGRITKILQTAKQAVLWAVEEAAARGRVKLLYVPGNHDRLLSYCLAMTADAWFRNAPQVTVDYAPTTRKYHCYGQVLIGMTHGDEEKHSSLPTIMATECPDAWQACKNGVREWHIGHTHKAKRVDYVGLDTHDGIPVRSLRSLSAVDAWHYRKGYVGTTRSAEALVYSQSAWVGHFVVNARDQ